MIPPGGPLRDTGDMPSERQSAIDAVVAAWTIPGVSAEFHEKAKTHLHLPTAEGGWPVLARAVEQLVAVEQERSQGRDKH